VRIPVAGSRWGSDGRGARGYAAGWSVPSRWWPQSAQLATLVPAWARPTTGLPGPAYHLEFTQHERGSPGPVPTRDNLLVFYLDGAADVARSVAALAELGRRPVAVDNPYWTDYGAVTVEDPDGWRVVLMPHAGFQDRPPRETVTVDWYAGDRAALRPLFALAEDSDAELDSYVAAGRVLAARAGGEVVGHLQLVDGGEPGRVEIKNMAVREDLHGLGIGGRLVREALTRLAVEGVSIVEVATAAADVGNLRFYQRLGSGCGRCSAMPSPSPPGTRRGSASTASPCVTGFGSTSTSSGFPSRPTVASLWA
jgi:ribosomal protein S18 acetylase RimI-like enzyme